jgi:glycosyltransferase involved in cell wall biosynthesis
VPVHNGQATLGDNVQRLLETLPELAVSFEIVIVDDGSTDATCELAYEFARDYPQVSVVRGASTLGWAAVVAQHAPRAKGEFVMIHCGGTIAPADIVGLWRLRSGIVAAKTTTVPRPHRVIPRRRTDRLGVHARAPRSNLLLIHRGQLDQLEKSLAESHHTGWPAAPKNHRRHGPSNAKRPNFLSRLKDFARGE